MLGIIFDSNFYLYVVKSEGAKDIRQRSILGLERFLHLFFKNIIAFLMHFMYFLTKFL